MIVLQYTTWQNMALHVIATILLICTISVASTVDLILKPNVPTCAVLISSFDPIKVEAIFPSIGSKQPEQFFKITLINDKKGEIQQTLQSVDNRVFRNNFDLESNIIYSLCFEFVTQRSFGQHDVVFMGFTAEEHFENKIGKIEIPKQLANEQNLKIMYEAGARMMELNSNTANNQKKERQLQDKLVDLNLHKGKRIVTITLIECFVIIVSGVYQILAMRKFLIEKNLY